ncbi:hypothetical protein N7468_005986 [Penicillium chermesinum]|uniref:Uncharacterized protein n=1 Tax=Penicillium chermesinum TaxID=63820 RepID=A0A9W9P0G7_9EURO|nr:uncharacterized protein N7468_005986 [Penicillium chermesinum]KAJ5233030.1 hypothetical protein N7468_005986 [Penicillium chermesinum]
MGRLQYTPFVTCNETSSPLSLHYGISETINCTIPSLSDSLYHLLEFYVHSDVPMTCRIPTTPLTSSSENHASKFDAETGASETDSLSEHDMNMLMHNMASDAAAQSVKPGFQSGQPGFAVAGTAYSTPEFESTAANLKLDLDEAAVTLAQAAREPWTSGHGTKVVRGEPLTFSFHVSWVEGGAGIGWPDRPAGSDFLGFGEVVKAKEGSSVWSIFSKLAFFAMAASVGGAGGALLGEEREPVAWSGDGILGVPPAVGKGSGVTFGNGGRINGYGGYSAANGAGTNGGGGYGGFPTGKRD